MHSGEEVDDSLGIGYPPQLEGTDLPKNMKYENAQWEEVDDSYWIGYRPQLAEARQDPPKTGCCVTEATASAQTAPLPFCPS